MNEQALKTVIAFAELSETDEVKEIKKKYLNNELSAFEFYQSVNEYLNRIKDDN